MGKIILLQKCDKECPNFEEQPIPQRPRCRKYNRCIDRIEFDSDNEFPVWCKLKESSEYNIYTGATAQRFENIMNTPPDPVKQERMRKRMEEHEKGYTKCDKCGQIDHSKGWTSNIDLDKKDENYRSPRMLDRS